MTPEAFRADRPAAARPLPRPVRLQQSVYEALLELAITGQLRPGQHLVESKLARQLGVSRQPVHEALHRLQAEGWVELRPGRGAVVHVPTDHEVDDLLDARQLLEAEIAQLVARKITPDQVDWLRQVCDDSETAADAGDTERFVAVNNDFHGVLAKIAGNAALAELADQVARRASQFYRVVAPLRGQESCAEHRELVEAIEERDQERAATLAREHVERTRAVGHRALPASDDAAVAGEVTARRW